VSLSGELAARLNVATWPGHIPGMNRRPKRAFIGRCAKSASGGGSARSMKGNYCRRGSTNTRTFITTSGLFWASACNLLYHLLVPVHMWGTRHLTTEKKSSIMGVF
jgi:hypothetical protein